MQADWELSKENFQPLKRGRKEVCKENSELCQKADAESQRKWVHAAEVCTCASCLDLDHRGHKVCYRHFWQELGAYNGDDPLDVWIRSASMVAAGIGTCQD